MGSDLLLFVLLRLIRIQFGSRTRYGAIRILKSCLRSLSSRWLDFRPFKTSTTHFCDWTIQSLFNLPIYYFSLRRFFFPTSFSDFVFQHNKNNHRDYFYFEWKSSNVCYVSSSFFLLYFRINYYYTKSFKEG